MTYFFKGYLASYCASLECIAFPRILSDRIKVPPRQFIIKRKIFKMIWVIFLINFALVNGVLSSDLYELDLIHFNDFHARFEETSKESPICHTNDTLCLGGFPRLYHVITQLKREKPDALLLNAGDSFQGTYWYTFFKWNVLQEFMNLLPHDAHAIGNHDFDDGPMGLAGYISALNAPVLAANMDTTFEPVLEGLYHPSTIVKRKGRKIGIIGLITTDTELFSNVGNVKFLDPRTSLKRELRVLNGEGVDIIIVLSHCGYDTDVLLAREFGKDVDVIVGGHSHREEKSPQPYPVVIESDANKNHKVLVVQASAFSKYVGNVTVYLDSEGHYVNWDGEMIYLNQSIPEDTGIKELLRPYAEFVHLAQLTPIGESMTPLSHEDCSRGECTLGNLMTDALNAVAKHAVQTSLDYIAFAQQSYLPSSLPDGIITHGELIELLPYYDQIETFNVQGKTIIDALEWGVRDAQFYNEFQIPLLLQVSGLKVQYNITNPEGKRVTSVRVGKDNVPLKRKKYYQVTAPGFLADGGDGYSVRVRIIVFYLDQITSYLVTYTDSSKTWFISRGGS
ncbi:hypothetical protein O3G_MSEX011674 [Manduca sexta]|uniref:Apyrase n=1 Tax=Manduca sexta TaxID=7130 RepID=A0A922CUH1_MANSE|nr:hypothetical protein O3G_MSEX011674 [Manduca sexta]